MNDLTQHGTSSTSCSNKVSASQVTDLGRALCISSQRKTVTGDLVVTIDAWIRLLYLINYLIPHLQDFAHILNGCEIFSALNLIRAHRQIPVAPEDRSKTAVITPFGLFEFNVMTFGLRNAAQTFQRLMEIVLRGLSFCHCHIDDIIIASTNAMEHEVHLRAVFECLEKFGLSINLSKCVFGASDVKYLSYNVSKDGTKPLEERVAAIRDFPKPKDISKLRRFLGIVNFYWCFLRDAATIQAPLHALLVGAKKRQKAYKLDTHDKYSFREMQTTTSRNITACSPTTRRTSQTPNRCFWFRNSYSNGSSNSNGVTNGSRWEFSPESSSQRKPDTRRMTASCRRCSVASSFFCTWSKVDSLPYKRITTLVKVSD